MDDSICEITSNNKIQEEACSRDENRSPSSGSSSETTLDNTKGADSSHRRHRRQSKAKRKRKWKPYTELSWDERQIQDDREAKRACAKRERLTAEGHPIAPYNTTQFLMEDHKNVGVGREDLLSQPGTATSSPNVTVETDMEKTESEGYAKESRTLTNGIESPYPASQPKSDSKKDGVIRDDIQKFILQDFSHTYADLRAEQLQTMPKSELVTECLKLEKKVESLERRVRDCKKRHSEERRNQADIRLLEKINQLQSQNAQLVKENASIASLRSNADPLPGT